MRPLKLGLNLDCLGQPPRPALLAAAKAGAEGVQFDAAGELAPDRLSATGRREFRTLLRGHGLEPAAVSVPLRRGLDASEDQSRRVDHVRKAMQLAGDLGCRAVVVPLPKLPADGEARGDTLREVLADLSAVADRTGLRLAVEPGLDPGPAVATYLDGFGPGGPAVCYDPANFLLNRHDPLAALTALLPRTAVVHARDGRAATVSGGGAETVLGGGDVDWFRTVAALDAGGYAGFLVSDRHDGPSRGADAAAGVGFLRRFVPAG